MANHHGKPPSHKHHPRHSSPKNEKIPVDSLLNTLKNDNNSYNRNEAAKNLGQYNLPLVIDALLETVRSDYKVRYQALVSLQKMKSTKALGTFIERLDDPSARIRKISIIALGDIGGKSAIEPVAKIFNTRDHEDRNQGIISRDRKTGKKPYGHSENVEAARKSLEKIRGRVEPIEPNTKVSNTRDHEERNQERISRDRKTGKKPERHPENVGAAKKDFERISGREASPIPIKPVESQLKPLDTYYPFDDTLTGKRPIKSEDAKQHELVFIERLGKKFEENGRTLKYNNKIFSINSVNDWGTFSNKKFSRDLNVPTNRYIEAKLVEKTLIVTGEKFTFKGHFYSRVKKYTNAGEDSAPIMLKEINPLLDDSIEEAKQINEPIFLLIASPTGFDKRVTDSVYNETGLCFSSKNLSIGLVDMGTGESFFNPHDELTKMFKPLCDLITIPEKIAKYQKFIFELLDNESIFYHDVQYSKLKEQCINSGYIDADLILKNFRDYAKERGHKIHNVPDVGLAILK